MLCTEIYRLFIAWLCSPSKSKNPDVSLASDICLCVQIISDNAMLTQEETKAKMGNSTSQQRRR